jgi:hypothetical protein
MFGCGQSTISADAFRHLAKLSTLDLIGCNYPLVGNDTFVHLGQLKQLKIATRFNSYISNEAFRYLGNLTSLEHYGGDIHSDDHLITGQLLWHLSSLRKLDIDGWYHTSFDDGMFQSLSNLRNLFMGRFRFASNLHITEKMFTPLKNLTGLVLYRCYGATVERRSISPLTSLKFLRIRECHNVKLTEECFKPLSELTNLDLKNSAHLELSKEACRQLEERAEKRRKLR